MNIATRFALDNSMPLAELCSGCPPNTFGRTCARLLQARKPTSLSPSSLLGASGAEPALSGAAASTADPALPDATASTAEPTLPLPALSVPARCLLDTCDPDSNDLTVTTDPLFQGWIGVSRLRLLGLVDSRYTGRGDYCFMVQSSDNLHQIAFGEKFEAEDTKNKKVYQRAHTHTHI